MKRILFVTNIPAPYRIDFFNELGKEYDLTVLFEAKRAAGIRFNWNENSIRHFRPVFLEEGEIREKKINPAIFRHIDKTYDHIVFTSYGYYTELAALLIRNLAGKPYYLEFDGCVLRDMGDGIKERLKKRILSRAAGVFSSGSVTDSFLLHYGVDPARIHRYPFTSLFARDIASAPSDREEKTSIRRALGIEENRVVFGAGQFIYRKGFDLLIRAATGFDPDVGVYIAGAEPTKEFIELGKGNPRIHYPGFLDKETLNAYMRASDLFVLPTREDMWGLVINEAMGQGLPVISTCGCIGARELITDGRNGILIPTDEVTPIITNVNTLLNDRTRLAEMANESLRSIRGYTVEQMVRSHKEVFGE